MSPQVSLVKKCFTLKYKTTTSDIHYDLQTPTSRSPTSTALIIAVRLLGQREAEVEAVRCQSFTRNDGQTDARIPKTRSLALPAQRGRSRAEEPEGGRVSSLSRTRQSQGSPTEASMGRDRRPRKDPHPSEETTEARYLRRGFC